jgi:hypothetical protein
VTFFFNLMLASFFFFLSMLILAAYFTQHQFGIAFFCMNKHFIFSLPYWAYFYKIFWEEESKPGWRTLPVCFWYILGTPFSSVCYTTFSLLIIFLTRLKNPWRQWWFQFIQTIQEAFITIAYIPWNLMTSSRIEGQPRAKVLNCRCMRLDSAHEEHNFVYN